MCVHVVMFYTELCRGVVAMITRSISFNKKLVIG